VQTRIKYYVKMDELNTVFTRCNGPMDFITTNLTTTMATTLRILMPTAVTG